MDDLEEKEAAFNALHLDRYFIMIVLAATPTFDSVQSKIVAETTGVCPFSQRTVVAGCFWEVSWTSENHAERLS